MPNPPAIPEVVIPAQKKFWVWTSTDSAGNTLVAESVYQAQEDGFVWGAGFGESGYIQISVGTSSTPENTLIMGAAPDYPNYYGGGVLPVAGSSYWLFHGGAQAGLMWLPAGTSQITCIKQ
jgi:hypothetical protein